MMETLTVEVPDIKKTVKEDDIQEVIDAASGFDPEMLDRTSNLIGSMIYANKNVPPWWSRARDVELRKFWKDGQQGSGMMWLAQNKLASIPFLVEARDKSIVAHVQQAKNIQKRLTVNSEFGQGLYTTMLRFAEDYLGQDNGGFIEVLGDGPKDRPIKGTVLGLRHLDSARCERTGDPMYPIVYRGDDGRLYKLHMARVIFFSQMPSSDDSMNGVGFCSVSRSLRILKNLQATVNYKDEKMGARDASKILVGSGITGKEIIKSITASYAMMDNLNLENMSRTVAIGSISGDMKLDKIELNNMEQFDEETTYTFAAYALAITWGLEFQELIPVLGNKSSEVVSQQRARGKLPQAYRRAFEEQASMKLVPDHLKIRLDYQDDIADQQRAIIEDIVNRSFERQINAGITTPNVAQEILYDRGYISEEQLREMKLSRNTLMDDSPIQSLFFDEHYAGLLVVPRELLIPSAVPEKDMAIVLIEANEASLYYYIGQTRSSSSRRMAREALTALAWLKSQYVFAPREDEEMEEEEQLREDSSGPRDGRLTNEEAGQNQGVGKAANFFISNRESLIGKMLEKESRLSSTAVTLPKNQ